MRQLKDLQKSGGDSFSYNIYIYIIIWLLYSFSYMSVSSQGFSECFNEAITIQYHILYHPIFTLRF
jgi:hypothetical protein